MFVCVQGNVFVPAWWDLKVFEVRRSPGLQKGEKGTH